MMRAVLRCVLLLCLLAGEGVHAQALRLPAPPQAGFTQHVGAALPLQLAFVDDGGRLVRLARYFSDKPVVLVLGYFHCPNLCSTLFDGVWQALAQGGAVPGSYRLLAVSIDPNETVARAAARRQTYRALDGDGGAWLTGGQDAIAALARAVGYAYQAGGDGEFAHPAGFVVATPDGRISQYVMGVRFAPAALRTALRAAGAGRSGTLAQQFALLCAHFAPTSGRYDGAAMAGVRAACLLVLASLVVAGLRWRARSRHA